MKTSRAFALAAAALVVGFLTARWCAAQPSNQPPAKEPASYDFGALQQSQERATDDALRVKLSGVWLTDEQWHNSLRSPTGTITLGTNGTFTQIVTETATHGAAKGTQETVTYSGSWQLGNGYLTTDIIKAQSKSSGEQPMPSPVTWRVKIIRVNDHELVCVAQINGTEPDATLTWKRSE